MNANGLFSHIAMIALAAGIAFFYIQPTYSEISGMQDDIALYELERQKVDEVNQQLVSLVDRLDGVSIEDQKKLLTYIPDEVDEIGVPRILQILAANAGLLIEDVKYDKVDQEAVNQAEQGNVQDFPVPHIVVVTVQGTYGQIKSMLQEFETNEYPLEVHELDITVVQGNFLTADISVVTYSHTFPETSFFIRR